VRQFQRIRIETWRAGGGVGLVLVDPATGERLPGVVVAGSLQVVEMRPRQLVDDDGEAVLYEVPPIDPEGVTGAPVAVEEVAGEAADPSPRSVASSGGGGDEVAGPRGGGDPVE
jgi:hypothetical protein